MPLNEEKITIGVVERETGFSKDLLRTWERRYGFPTPIAVCLCLMAMKQPL